MSDTLIEKVNVDKSDLDAFPKLKEVHTALESKRDELAGIFAEAGEDRDLEKVKSVAGGKDAVLARIRELNDEMIPLAKSRKEQIDLARAVKAMESNDDDVLAELFGETSDGVSPFTGRKKVSDFGEMFLKSGAGSKFKGQEVELPDFDLRSMVGTKTLFSTSAGWAPETTRGPRFVDDAQRPVQVVDLIPQTTTTQSSVTFMEETTFTNNAAEVAEGGAKPEAALALTEQTSPVRKIAVWLPVTDEQLEDEPRARQYLNNRLPFMVRQRLDGQIVAGDGVAPNLDGFLNVGGIQTQAKGADPTPDAVYKAMTKVEVTGQAFANLAIFHPNDWQDVRLLRTADGIYIWGNPSEAGPEMIWGLKVAKAQAMTENTALVLDTTFTELAVRKGMTIKTTDSHGEFFTSNKQVVLAEIRVALVVYRPAAICSVTGI